MTHEEIEMLTAAADVLDALRDQIRYTSDGRVAFDLRAEERLNEILILAHSLIADATHASGHR